MLVSSAAHATDCDVDGDHTVRVRDPFRERRRRRRFRRRSRRENSSHTPVKINVEYNLMVGTGE